MINEINTPLKKSRNINIDSFPKITKTYTLYKKCGNLKSKYITKNNKIKIIKKGIFISNYLLIQNNLVKHNSSPKKIVKFKINKLINSTHCHLLVKYKENILLDLQRELIKRYYKKDESIERIPIYAKYYKNYLQFFGKPTFSEYHINKIIHEYEEYLARIYYKSHCEKNKNKPKLKNENNSLKVIFNNSVRNDIEEIKFSSRDFIESNNYSQDETIPENTLLQSYKNSPENSIKSILSLFNYDKRKKKRENKVKNKTSKIIKNDIFEHKYKTRNYKFKPSLYLENEIVETKLLNTDGNDITGNNKKKLKLCDIKGISIQTNLDLNTIKKENIKLSIKDKMSRNQENNLQIDNLSINKVIKYTYENNRDNSFKRAKNKSRRIIKDEKQINCLNKISFRDNKINNENKKKRKMNNHSFSTSSRINKNSKHSSISTHFHFSFFQKKGIKNNNSAKVFSAEQTTRNSDFSYSNLKNKINKNIDKKKNILKKNEKKYV